MAWAALKSAVGAAPIAAAAATQVAAEQVASTGDVVVVILHTAHLSQHFSICTIGKTMHQCDGKRKSKAF